MEQPKPLDKKTVKKFVVDSIKTSLDLSGKTTPQIDSKTRPLMDIAGFDSHLAIEACLFIEEKINHEFKSGQEVYLFFDKKKGSHMNIDETTDYILKIAN
jgi:hypothetical protein